MGLCFQDNGESIQKLVKVIKGEHLYEIHEVLITSIIGGHQRYLDWVPKNTK